MKKIFDIITQWQNSSFSTVWVADTTPREGATYKEMSYIEFAKHHNFEPIEATVALSKSDSSYIQCFSNKVPIKAYLINPHNKLFLAPMDQPLGINPVKGLGYAVYYYPDADKPIKSGTMISHYAGTKQPGKSEHLHDYLYTLSSSVAIDAELNGNISRFLPHLPSGLELKFFVMPKKIRHSIAKANLEIQPYVYQKEGALAIVANQSINPADMIGYSYNIDYFLARGVLPVYYDKKGLPLDLSKVIFDKRRYLIFSAFNQQIFHFNQLSRKKIHLKPEWLKLIEEIESAILFFDSDDCSYFDFETNLQKIFQGLKQAYDEGLAEAFAQSSMKSVDAAKTIIIFIESLLYFEPKNQQKLKLIEQNFHTKFTKLPTDHPQVKTHTLDLSNPQKKQTSQPQASKKGMFATPKADLPAQNSSEGSIYKT